jgi:hypothetical protein
MNLGDWLWAMLAFFFWFTAIWIFIQISADIFRPGEHDWVKLPTPKVRRRAPELMF